MWFWSKKALTKEIEKIFLQYKDNLGVFEVHLMNKMRKEMQKEMQEAISDIKSEVNDAISDIRSEVDEIKQDIDDDMEQGKNHALECLRSNLTLVIQKFETKAIEIFNEKIKVEKEKQGAKDGKNNDNIHTKN